MRFPLLVAGAPMNALELRGFTRTLSAVMHVLRLRGSTEIAALIVEAVIIVMVDSPGATKNLPMHVDDLPVSFPSVSDVSNSIDSDDIRSVHVSVPLERR